MKPELSQIPSESQSKPQVKSTTGTNPDSLYALLRRLNARVSEIESLIAIVRRDVARIDRKVYRDEGQASAIKTTLNPAAQNLVDPDDDLSWINQAASLPL